MRLPAALVVSALAGFVGLSYEVLWYRALSYVTGAAPWSFGALLGAYLLGVAAASAGARAFCARRPAPARRDVALVAAFVGLANLAAFMVIPVLAALATRGRWEAALPLLGVAAGLLGAVLPLVAHFAIAPDREAGVRLSYVYVADIVGSAAGSAVSGYVLLDVLDTRALSVLLAAVGFALTAAVVAAAGLGRRAALAGVALAVLATGATVAAAPLAFDRLWERLALREHDDGSRYARVLENRHGVIAVSADGVVYGGGVYDGAFSTDPLHDRNGIYRAFAVAALHPAPRQVLLVGLGSGSWARVLSSLPGVERLTVVEINPGYLEIIRDEPEVAGLLADPRVEIAVDDGRRWLARHPERRFDVIVANVTLHWRAHATSLLSREFVELARAHLAEGGVYYFNTTFFRPARETALALFANGMQVGTFFAASDAPLAWDGARLERALEETRIGGRPVVDAGRPEELARARAMGAAAGPPLLRPQPPLRVITDDNMLPEWHGTPFDLRTEGHVTR